MSPKRKPAETASSGAGAENDETFDLVVLGSGAAGLAGAVTAAHAGLRVAVLEKSDKVGGTSAWSGGHVWIPGNRHEADLGIADSTEEAVAYLLSLSRGLMDEDLVRAFVTAGPEAVSFLDEIAGTDFRVSAGIPDYYPEHPGGKTGGGRTLECPLFAFGDLGDWAERVQVSPYYVTPHLVMNETPTGRAVPAVVAPEEMARRRRLDLRGLGQSLVGRLLAASLRLGVEIRLGHHGIELRRDDDGTVTGVVAQTGDVRHSLRARAGVLLATGGFEWNAEYCRAFLRGPMTHPISIETNTGDGLYLAMKAGAMLANMREAYWTTVAELPPGINSRNKIMLSADRARPRAIIVNRHGERFANESANYNSFGGAFHQEDVTAFEYRNLPCWLVFDHEYLRRYGTIGCPPGETAPGWITAGDSIEALAVAVGVPADALRSTIERWNAGVRDGLDPDFGRGTSAHDRWWGDPHAKGTIAGSLGPLDTPPYYAIEVHPGAMGTKGGPKIDGHARVIDLDGDAIPGLYAAGNVMGAPFAMTYGGAGGTLGPALTAGYLAGRHVSRRKAERAEVPPAPPPAPRAS